MKFFCVFHPGSENRRAVVELLYFTILFPLFVYVSFHRLDKTVYRTGETMKLTVNVNNKSSELTKAVKCSVIDNTVFHKNKKTNCPNRQLF